jgi:hypothetical protein
MTLLACIKLGLRRAGLAEGSSTYQDYAREFFNHAKDDIASRHRWRWLRTKSATFDSVASQREYSLASDVLYPIAFYHKDDGFRVHVETPEVTYEIDPKDATTGRGEVVAIAGLDSSGNWEIEFSNIPSAAGDTYFYTYQSKIADKTASNDGTSLDPDLPLNIQQAFQYYIGSEMMSLFGGHDADTEKEMQMYERRVVMAQKNQANIQGNQRYRSKRKNSRASSFSPSPIVNWPITS